MNYSPITITSKLAKKHLLDIKSKHFDMIQGMQDQALRVQQLNTEKETNQRTIDTENKTNQIETDKNNQANEMKKLEMENKRRELDIKAQALQM